MIVESLLTLKFHIMKSLKELFAEKSQNENVDTLSFRDKRQTQTTTILSVHWDAMETKFMLLPVTVRFAI